MSYKGKTVVITDCSTDFGELCARIFAEQGARTVFIRSDVEKNKEVENLIVETVDKLGKIDCLINIVESEERKPIDEISVEEFRELLEVNLINTFAICKAALPYLRLTKGNIINISGFDASPYNTTKGAINSFTKALAVDEAAYEVRANSISVDVSDAAKQKEIFEEAARMCLFLAADAAFTTGVNHVIE